MPDPILTSGDSEAMIDNSPSEDSSLPESIPTPINPTPAAEQLDPNSVEAVDFNNETETPGAQTPATDKNNTVGSATDALRKLLNGNSEASRPVGTPKPDAPSFRARDYSGIPADHVPVFKKMGDKAFEFFKPLYFEHKQLKDENAKLKTDFETASKSSIYDREDAYELMPEYKHNVKNLELLDGELNHWQQQLVNIRNGENFIPLIGYTESGEPQYGTPVPPTVQQEAMIFNMLSRGNVLKGQIAGKIDNLKNTFGSEYKSFISKITEIEDKLFPEADKEVLNKVGEMKLVAFPRHLHHNPIVRALAKALGMIDGMNILLNEARSSSTTANLKAKTAANAGPRAGMIQTSGGKGAGKVGDVLDEFKKARQQGIL